MTLQFFASDANQLLHGCRPLPPHVRTVHSSIDSLDVTANASSDEDSDLEEGWVESNQSVADGLRQVGVSKSSCFICGQALHTPYIKCGCGTKMTGPHRNQSKHSQPHSQLVGGGTQSRALATRRAAREHKGASSGTCSCMGRSSAALGAAQRHTHKLV